MFDPRALFQATTAIGGVLTGFIGGRRAEAKLPKKADVEPRGTDRRLERLPKTVRELHSPDKNSFIFLA